MKSLKVILAMTAVAAVAQSTTVFGAFNVPVLNGGFEAPVSNVGYLPVYSGDSTTIPNWTVGGSLPLSSVDLMDPSWWTGAQGTPQSLDMSGYNAGSITQGLSVANGTYNFTVTFYLAGNGASQKDLQVSLGLAQPQTVSSIWAAPDWRLQSLSFNNVNVSGGSVPLTFESLTPGVAGAALDQISVVAAAVPEPSTYFAGMSALGMLCLFGRRNRK